MSPNETWSMVRIPHVAIELDFCSLKNTPSAIPQKTHKKTPSQPAFPANPHPPSTPWVLECQQMRSRLPKELHSIGGEDLCTVGQAGFPNAHRGFRGLFTCNEEVNKTTEKSGVVQPEFDAPQKSGKKNMKIPGDLDHSPQKSIGSGQIIKFPPNPDFPNKKSHPYLGMA